MVAFLENSCCYFTFHNIVARICAIKTRVPEIKLYNHLSSKQYEMLWEWLHWWQEAFCKGKMKLDKPRNFSNIPLLACFLPIWCYYKKIKSWLLCFYSVFKVFLLFKSNIYRAFLLHSVGSLKIIYSQL